MTIAGGDLVRADAERLAKLTAHRQSKAARRARGRSRLRHRRLWPVIPRLPTIKRIVETNGAQNTRPSQVERRDDLSKIHLVIIDFDR